MRRFILCSTLLMAACNGNQAQLEEFSSPTGAFTIATPVPLEATQESVQTPVGPIEIHTFQAETEDSAYVVAYSDYPAAIVTESDPEMLLNSSRDGAISNVGGTLVSEEAIEIDGNPGRSLVISTGEGTAEPAVINSRIYLVDNRLYQILVVTPEGAEQPAVTDGFLESFDLN